MPIDLGRTLRPNATTVQLQTTGGTGNVDALLVMPEVATLLSRRWRARHRIADLEVRLHRATVRYALGGSGVAGVSSYDRMGRLVSQRSVDRGEPGGDHRAGRLHRPHPLSLVRRPRSQLR